MAHFIITPIFNTAPPNPYNAIPQFLSNKAKIDKRANSTMKRIKMLVVIRSLNHNGNRGHVESPTAVIPNGAAPDYII